MFQRKAVPSSSGVKRSKNAKTGWVDGWMDRLAEWLSECIAWL